MYRAERLPGSVGRWLTLESMYCSATLLLIFGKYTLRFCGFTSIKKKQLFSMFRHWFFLICALHSVKQGSAPFSSGYQRTAGFLSSIQKYLSSWKKKKGWRSNLTYLINEMEWDWPDPRGCGNVSSGGIPGRRQNHAQKSLSIQTHRSHLSGQANANWQSWEKNGRYDWRMLSATNTQKPTPVPNLGLTGRLLNDMMKYSVNKWASDQ